MPAGMPGMFICVLISHSSPVFCAAATSGSASSMAAKKRVLIRDSPLF